MSTTTNGLPQAGRGASRATGMPGFGGGGPGTRPSGPPKQRRPALAALALVLIVGGALIAALVAVRMDSREQVLVAKHDIAPGTKISATDLTTARVAPGGVPVIAEDEASQVIGRTYALGKIRAGSLIDQTMLNTDPPLVNGRSEVSVALDSSLAPAAILTGGDLVEIVRTSGTSSSAAAAGGGQPVPITQALVLSVQGSGGSSGGLSGDGTSTPTATLLVPTSAAAAVIDASGAKAAGIALLKRGQSIDVALKADNG